MTQVIETVKEDRWRRGKEFLFLMNFNGVLAGAEIDVLICVGDKPIIIENMGLEANVEKMLWQAFFGAEFTAGTGIDINAIARNASADTASLASVTVSPTVTSDGSSFTAQPLNLVSQIYRNNAYYLKQDLISSDFTFKENSCYLIRLTNNSDDTTDLQFTISTSNS